MKTRIAVAALAALVFVGCAGKNVTVVPKTQRINIPPSGKALVNFHRVTSYGYAYRFPIFNLEGTYICELPAKAQFQYVCNPGPQVFMAWADQVTVVKADLAPDKVYDIMCDVSMGMWKADIKLSPMLKNDPRRSRLTEFEERANLVLPERTAVIQEREQKNQKRCTDIRQDFLSGNKADRVKTLGRDDCR